MNEGFNAATALSDDWETPRWLFDALNHEFGFTLDGAASAANALLPRYSSAERHLGWRGERVFCNPPYSMIDVFVETALGGCADIAVLLLPVRTDTAWWQRLMDARDRGRDVTIRWFRKRIRFCLNGTPEGSPRFASVVVIVR